MTTACCFLVAGGLTMAAALDVAAQATPAPSSQSLFRLTYETHAGPARDSATAFLCAVSDSEPPIVITAYHTFAWRALRRDTTFSSDRITALVTKVLLTSPANSVSNLAGRNIPVPGAAVATATDLALFEPPPTLTEGALRLAVREVGVGDTVWLFAPLRGKAPNYGLLHPAGVIGMENGLLWYALFDHYLAPNDSVRRAEVEGLRGDPDLADASNEQLESYAWLFHLMFTSGAPVLNGAGEVIAVHVLAGDRNRLRQEDPDCCTLYPSVRFIGGGVPARSVRTHVRSVRR